MPGALESVQPLGEDEFDALLRPFLPLSPVFAVAVSGGSDSMALAVCARRWAQRYRQRCVAFIVDHGLRAESAAEAVTVKNRLAALELSAEILRWQHDSIATRLHERARAARYRLLIDACRRHGVGDLLIGHHREDQAETILMRLSKGSDIDGLAGMAAQNARDGVRLLRPFLTLSKQCLRATCAAAQIDTVADPSNASAKYARGRLRAVMPALAQEGLSVDTLTLLGARAADARDALDHYTREFLRQAATRAIGGSLRLDREKIGAAPRAIGLRALARCLRHIHDGAYPPAGGNLVALLDALSDGNAAKTRSFYGCLISLTPRHALILREPAAATHVAPFHGGATVLWDGRWLISGNAETSGGGDVVRALGAAPHQQIDAMAPDLRHLVPQGRVRASLPALWRGDVVRAIPSFDPKAEFRMSYHKPDFP